MRGSEGRENMGTMNIVLCGLGGQGILFMTKMLAQTALRKNIQVMGAETHGMAQRGGSVVSHLRLGEVEGSLVRAGTADILLALEENEAYRNLPYLGKGGRMYVNGPTEGFPSPQVALYLEKNGIACRCVEAGKVAMEQGSPMSSNLALVGFFSAFGEGPFTFDDLRDTVERISPEKFRDTNLRIFDACHQIGAGRS
jgi:indolepyruvate ferredoxin oxidoreductase, beta subunit